MPGSNISDGSGLSVPGSRLALPCLSREPLNHFLVLTAKEQRHIFTIR